VNTFQQYMEDRRKALGLTWPKLTERAGMPYSTVRRIILGPMVQPPKPEQLEALSKALNVPLIFSQQLIVEALYGYKLYEQHTDEGLQAVAATWPELTERDRRMIKRMAEEAWRERNDGPGD
jgi:transcriptional regulator with XRE-family HTH domain